MLLATLFLLSAQQQRVDDNLMATNQLLQPVGRHLVMNARPDDMEVTADAKYVLVKENRGLSVIQAADWKTIQEVRVPGGASMHGLLLQGDQVYFSDARSTIHVGTVSAEGAFKLVRTIPLPKPKIGGEAY